MSWLFCINPHLLVILHAIWSRSLLGTQVHCTVCWSVVTRLSHSLPTKASFEGHVHLNISWHSGDKCHLLGGKLLFMLHKLFGCEFQNGHWNTHAEVLSNNHWGSPASIATSIPVSIPANWNLSQKCYFGWATCICFWIVSSLSPTQKEVCNLSCPYSYKSGCNILRTFLQVPGHSAVVDHLCRV